MRKFIIVSHRAKADGNFSLDDLCGGAGRMDVLLRCINAAFFISNNIRKNVEVYIVFSGSGSAPKTIRLVGSELKYLNPDERSTGALIKNALLKDIKESEIKSTPGIYVSKKNFEDVLKECILCNTRFNVKSSTDTLSVAEYINCQIIYLKEDGVDIRETKLSDNMSFVLGDEKDLTGDEEKILEKCNVKTVSVGPVSLHASHCIVLVQNELDRKE